MATLLASFFSFIIGVIAGSGLGLNFLWSSAVSLAAYFVAKKLLVQFLGSPSLSVARAKPSRTPDGVVLGSEPEDESAADARAWALREQYRASGFRGTYEAWLERQVQASRD